MYNKVTSQKYFYLSVFNTLSITFYFLFNQLTISTLHL